MVRTRAARLRGLVVAVAVVVAGCGTDPGAGTDPSADPLAAAGLEVDTSWVLTSFLLTDEEVALLDGSPITLARTEQGIEGTSGCNQYGADGQQLVGDGGRLFPPLYVTEMACLDPGVMELETTYLGALADVTTATSEAGTLVLSGDGATLRFDRAG